MNISYQQKLLWLTTQDINNNNTIIIEFLQNHLNKLIQAILTKILNSTFQFDPVVIELNQMIVKSLLQSKLLLINSGQIKCLLQIMSHISIKSINSFNLLK
ncbi:unnamed protein product [Paramecium pentaurelia]|uniref:Uncharacterized protein n=1 Tax=Paramecium pentaurelia TaxID=43138 RepID=A0A8S1RTW7_9CILI|nr:unnamed protein product [Paramecium pentaurelia]